MEMRIGRGIKAVDHAVAIIVIIKGIGCAVVVGIIREMILIAVGAQFEGVGLPIVVAVPVERIAIPGVAVMGKAQHLLAVINAVAIGVGAVVIGADALFQKVG